MQIQPSEVVYGVGSLIWLKHLVVNQRTAGSNPVLRPSFYGPVVYWLGSEVFILKERDRYPPGSLRREK